MARLTSLLVAFSLLLFAGAVPAPSMQDAQPGADKPKVGTLPHLEFDARTKRVRVECESVNVEAPLEFFCVGVNGPDHETVLRSRVRPSDLHTALLAIGLKPGSPVTFVEKEKRWEPPHGDRIKITCEWQQKDGKTVAVPAHRMMRDLKTKKEMPETTWIFAGSRTVKDGDDNPNYAADVTGYVVSIVNFDLTLIDVPDLASNSNETLEWECNRDVVPPRGTKVTMILEPAQAGKGTGAAAADTQPKAGK
jgi:hypothetical protein